MFWTIGFQMATAKSIAALPGYPSIIEGKWNSKVFGLIIGCAIGLLFTIPFHVCVLPLLMRSTKPFYLSFGIFGKKAEENNNVKLERIGSTKSFSEVEEQKEKDPEDEQIKKVFRPLQVFAACFAAFNHGGNDVGNCIGPLVTIYVMYSVSIVKVFTKNNLF